MQITPIRLNTQSITTNNNNKYVKNPVSTPLNVLKDTDVYHYYQPNFRGILFETRVIKSVKDKEFQGEGIYRKLPTGSFIDLKKLNYKNICKEPLDITKSTRNEITAHRFSLALIENNARNPDEDSEFSTQWVTKYNPDNRHSPLAVSHALNDFFTMEEIFAKNRQILRDPGRCKSLDIPITDKEGNLCIDAIVFDTETTGTNINKDKIVQIGARLIKNGRLVKGEEGEYDKLINPEIPIPPGASAVNEITDEMVKDAPPIEGVMNEFLGKYMNKGNGVIVAWNGVKFDIPLLNRTIRELREVNDIKPGNPKDKIISEKQLFKVLDPQILIMRIHPFLGASKKLSNQYHWMFCKPMEDAHDALADVNGTIPILKYCLYWLNEHRTNKSVPLTLRQVLLFQNGAPNIPEIESFLHPSKNFNANVQFKVSYRPENLDVINYFDKYYLDENSLYDLEEEIGEINIQKLKDKEIVGTKINDKYKGSPLQAAETKKIPNSNKKISLSYVMRENFKKVLGFAELEPYNGKTKEEIEDIIIEKSKVYLGEDSKTLFIKNTNPDDVPLGNDLPDDNITRKVMQEMKEDEE
ncbi:MAG: 3'-5' exonuclease [Candidatus Gastranaerophilales bacterium]|nr:3'-5' exonuclease [Candidatus Gastranaerophilales bacterium]